MTRIAKVAQFACASLVLLVSSASPASGPAESPALPCSLQQGFGQVFGSRKLKGFIRFRLGSALVRPQKSHAPFSDIEVGVMKKTRRVWRTIGAATFSDRAAADSFVSDLVQRFESAFPISEKAVDARENKTTLYTGHAKKCETDRFGQTKCYHSDGAMFEINYFEMAIEPHTVTLICDDISLQGDMLAEEFAKD